MTKPTASVAQLIRKAQQKIQQSKYQAALKVLEPLLKRSPVLKEASKWAGLAFTLMRDYEQALPLLEDASKAYPDDPDVLSSLGGCYFELDYLPEAEQAYKQSLQLRPDHSHTLFELAKVLGIEHKYNEELDVLTQLIEFHPESVDVWYLFSKHYRFADLNDPQVLKLRKLEDKGLAAFKPEEQVRLCSALGKMYEDLVQPETAFYYYQQSNTLQKSLNLAPPSSLIRLLHIYRYFYSPEQTVRLRSGSGLEEAPELMIVGMPRSGKSLIESLVGCHPQVQVAGETNSFVRYAKRLASFQSNALDYFSKDPAALRHDARSYLKSRTWPESRFVTSTLPGNIEVLSFLGAWFPKAPLIFVTRNLEDLGLAVYFKHIYKAHSYSLDLYETGREIAATEALIDLWTQVLPNPCVKVRYEDLVNRPAQVSKALYQFLDLDWKPEYFAGLKEQRHLSENIAPHQSLDTPAPLRNDYIGWSKPYQQYLQPLHEGYQSLLDELKTQPK